MVPCLKRLVLVIAIVVIAMGEGGKSGLLPPKTRVQIINDLPQHQDLTLHCKDKHHDLGEQTVKFGETYEFRFRPNPISGTLYFCRFWWPSFAPRYFDIYRQDRDDCKVCTWKVHEDGPCLSGACYPWNPPQQQQHSTLTSLHDVTSNTHMYDVAGSHLPHH